MAEVGGGAPFTYHNTVIGSLVLPSTHRTSILSHSCLQRWFSPLRFGCLCPLKVQREYFSQVELRLDGRNTGNFFLSRSVLD